MMSAENENQRQPEKVVSMLRQRAMQILANDAINLTAEAKKMLATMVEQFREIDTEGDVVELRKRITLVGIQIVTLATDTDVRGIKDSDLKDNVQEGDYRAVLPSDLPNYVTGDTPRKIGDLIEEAQQHADIACGLSRDKSTQSTDAEGKRQKEIEKMMKYARDKLYEAVQELFSMMTQKAQKQKILPPPGPDYV